MYKLYYKQGTCSLAPHALLNFLEQKYELIDASKVDNFKSISPTGAVPCLVDGNTTITEGAAIALYLMEKHNSPMLPKDNLTQIATYNRWMLFANATVHPLYSRLFFLMKNGKNENLMNATFNQINEMWKIVEDQLTKNKFMTGNEVAMADIFLTVYANWNHFFGDSIKMGPNAIRMVKEVAAKPAFQKALEEEKLKFTIQ